jgi:hypothetical protein
MGTIPIDTPPEPPLVALGIALRQAFQSGSDERMLDVLLDQGLAGKVAAALNEGNDRTLTFAAPYIADLAVRLGRIEQQR